MSPQYGELRPIDGGDRFRSLGTKVNFSGFRLAFVAVLERRHLSEANQTLHDVCLSHGLVQYIYITFSGALVL